MKERIIRKRNAIFFILTSTCLDVTSAQAAKSSLLIRNAEVIDVNSEKGSIHRDIKIIDGVITEIAQNIASGSIRELDLKGLRLMPGLIDTHVHLRSIPGSMYRKDDAKTYLDLFNFHLRAYLGAGITTILDAAAPEDLILQMEELAAMGHVMPRVLYLAPFLTPENGYFSSDGMRTSSYATMWPAIKNTTEIENALKKGKILKSSGAKLTIEQGFGPFKIWPVFDEPTRQYIVKRAAAHELPLFIHSWNESMGRIALSMRPKAIMHGGFSDEQPSDEFLDLLKKSGSYVVSTLSVDESTLIRWQPERLKDNLNQLLTPPLERTTAADPKAWEYAFSLTSNLSVPTYMPHWMVRLFDGFFVSQRAITSRKKSSQLAIGSMFKRGVPIVMGTDSGCWPILPQIFHGSTSIREMELLVEAGLPPKEAIRAATINAAKMLKIDHLVGSIEVGKRADFIVLAQDPTQNISSLRNLTWIIKDGEARTPKEWIER